MPVQIDNGLEEQPGGPGVVDALIGFHRLLGNRNTPEALALAASDLSETLSAVGAKEARMQLERLGLHDISGEDLNSAWTSLFVRGTVPPYETSHMPPSMAGHLGELADIAGFYKAFGLEVQGERPDHLVPELEFLTFASLKYIEALRASNSEAAEMCADAIAGFLEDHFGTWIGAFAARVSAELPRNPYEPIIQSLATFVSWLCRMTDISPRPLSTKGPGMPPTPLGGDEAEPTGCLGCPLPGDREIDIPY